MVRGERVIAWWPNEKDWWYAGVICESAPDEIEVQYDDCNRATLKGNQVRPFNIGVGSRVYVRWRGGESYYPGRVGMVDGNAFFVQYDDGDEEWSSVSAMRFHQADF